MDRDGGLSTLDKIGYFNVCRPIVHGIHPNTHHGLSKNVDICEIYVNFR